jgi:hypothetical protein
MSIRTMRTSKLAMYAYSSRGIAKFGVAHGQFVVVECERWFPSKLKVWESQLVDV